MRTAAVLLLLMFSVAGCTLTNTPKPSQTPDSDSVYPLPGPTGDQSVYGSP